MACVIETDHPGPFSPGSTITGKIMCMFPEILTIEGIKCSLEGRERTFFQLDSRYLVGDDVFFKDEVSLLDACTVPTGTYKYPFTLTLPDSGIPSSFNHKFGKVTYEIQAAVSKGEGRFYKNTHLIDVFVPVNLNEMSTCMVPLVYPYEETLSCCINFAQVFMDVTLEKDGFLLGEVIKIEVNVNNVSNAKVKDVAVILNEKTRFIADNEFKNSVVAMEVLASKANVGPRAQSQQSTSFNLTIPKNLFLPNFKNCKYFQQWHTLTIKVSYHECFDNAELEIYVKLANSKSIGFHQPTQGSTSASSPSNNRIVPVAQAPVVVYPPPNRPPYPTGDSNFPMPNGNSLVMPPIPSVHHPTSMPMAGAGRPPGRTNRRAAPSAPLAEGEADPLMSRHGEDSELPTPPPTYEEATKTANQRN